MQCPFCESDSSVLETRPLDHGGGVRRRRRCKADPTHTYHSIEVVDAGRTAVDLRVIGLDGQARPFDLQGIRQDIKDALASPEDKTAGGARTQAVLDELIDGIVARVGNLAARAAGSRSGEPLKQSQIDEIVLQALMEHRSVYAVTRIRYAFGRRVGIAQNPELAEIREWLLRPVVWPSAVPRPEQVELEQVELEQTTPQHQGIPLLVRKRPPGGTVAYDRNKVAASVRFAAKGLTGSVIEGVSVHVVAAVEDRAARADTRH